MTSDITCVLTAHREGRLAVPSLRSFWVAIEHAEKHGYTVQPVLCLDRPDELTEMLFREYRREATELLVCDFGDQGKVRNAAVEIAGGRYTAFLDGDDLWSRTWLQQGLDFLKDKPDNVIAHPEFNYFFEQQATIYCHIDQDSPEFRIDMMRFANYWDALCISPTRMYVEYPFCDRDIEGGWAYEDWFWNCETLAAGIVHKAVPKTILFKRRQQTSQTIKASTNKSLIRANPLSVYDSSVYSGAAPDPE